MAYAQQLILFSKAHRNSSWHNSPA